MPDSSHFYRRRLPHYRERDANYFVTWRLAPGKELSSPERDLIAAELHHNSQQRYELYAYVVMNDHVHVLLQFWTKSLWRRLFIRGSRSPLMSYSVGTDAADESGRMSTSTGLSGMKKSLRKSSATSWATRGRDGRSSKSIAGFGRKHDHWRGGHGGPPHWNNCPGFSF